MNRDIVAIRGGGDIATGIAHRLHRSGFKVLLMEIEKPLVIRRTVAFAQAIYNGEVVIEGVRSEMARSKEDILRIWEEGHIPIVIDRKGDILKEIEVGVLVDGILAKRNLGTNRWMAPITIAAGPGFEAGKDVDIVIETNRGHDLGKLIFEGYAEANTGTPGEIMGIGKERVIKAPSSGTINNILNIGEAVKKGDIIAKINDIPVVATIDGVLRGLIMDSLEVEKGLKIADIDPRGIKEYCYTISEKARAVGGGVLEAILYLKSRE